MKKNQLQQPVTPEGSPDEMLRAQELNTALEAMRRGESPQYFSAEPEFQEALRLHVQTANAEIDDDFKDDVEQILLQRFGRKYAEQKPQMPRRASAWRALFLPAASLAAIGVVAFVITQVLNVNQAGRDDLQNNGVIAQANKNAAGSGDESTGNTNLGTSGGVKNSTNNDNESNSAGEKPPQPTVKTKPLAETAGVELVDVQSEAQEIDALQSEIEATIDDLESILDELEEIEQVNNFDAILNDLEAI